MSTIVNHLFVCNGKKLKKQKKNIFRAQMDRNDVAPWQGIDLLGTGTFGALIRFLKIFALLYLLLFPPGKMGKTWQNWRRWCHSPATTGLSSLWSFPVTATPSVFGCKTSIVHERSKVISKGQPFSRVKWREREQEQAVDQSIWTKQHEKTLLVSWNLMKKPSQVVVLHTVKPTKKLHGFGPTIHGEGCSSPRRTEKGSQLLHGRCVDQKVPISCLKFQTVRVTIFWSKSYKCYVPATGSGYLSRLKVHISPMSILICSIAYRDIYIYSLWWYVVRGELHTKVRCDMMIDFTLEPFRYRRSGWTARLGSARCTNYTHPGVLEVPLVVSTIDHLESNLDIADGNKNQLQDYCSDPPVIFEVAVDAACQNSGSELLRATNVKFLVKLN